jgi:uncharacterized NAD(P)/FAD-binding protein YdhS
MKTPIHVVGDGAASIAMVLRLAKDGHQDVTWHGGRHIWEEVKGRSVTGRPYGIAYRTNNGNHLLNAPAVSMSLFPDEESFPAYLERVGFVPESGSTASVFAPRLVYRQYLRSLLLKYWDVVSRYSLTGHLEGGNAVEIYNRCERMVLCLGATHRQYNGFGDWECVQNPWDFDYARVKGARKALILGSGLTAIDTALSIWSVDDSVLVHFVSRSGRFPLPHTDRPSKVPAARRKWGTDTKSVRVMLREFRADVARGISWVALMNDARHLWKHIWRGLPDAEKRRFIRHVRPMWEIHRHRMVEQTHEALEQHPMTISKINVEKANPKNYDFVFNATGVDTDPLKNMLLYTLITGKILKNAYDQKGNAVHGLVGTRGCKVGNNIWCVGAYMRPERWEATAMHDIVDMVDTVANQFDL